MKRPWVFWRIRTRSLKRQRRTYLETDNVNPHGASGGGEIPKEPWRQSKLERVSVQLRCIEQESKVTERNVRKVHDV